MTMPDALPQPYHSLDTLRKANDDLLDSLPGDALSPTAEQSRQNEERIIEFIRQAAATGAFLDKPADRRAAQGIIDYWVATFYSAQGNRTAQHTLPSRSDTQLRPFDHAWVQSLADRADAVIRALDPGDQRLARRTLLKLIQLPQEGMHFTFESMSRDVVLSLDDPQRVQRILDELEKVDVLTKDASNHVQLRYEALTRHWTPLHDWLDERIKFRAAALYWERSNKDPGALLGQRLAEQAREIYSDLNDLEQEFLYKSAQHARQQRKERVLLALAGLVVGGLVLAAGYWYSGYRLRQEAQATQDLLSLKQTPEEKGRALKLLAARGIRSFPRAWLVGVQVPGISIEAPIFIFATLGADATMRKTSFAGASLPHASFSQGTIRDSNFSHAVLEFSRFDNATIASTDFSGAKLYRAIFDRASLINTVDFSQADVASASFCSTLFDDNSPPTFAQSAWWLAFGWTLRRIDLFKAKFGEWNYMSSTSFKNEENRMKDEIAKNKAGDRTLFRAGALNGWAWMVGTSGAETEDLSKADKMVTEALTILDQLPGKESEEIKAAAANFKDTQAYILMQKATRERKPESFTSAARLLEESIKAKREIGVSVAETKFRYAIVFNALEQENDAIQSLREAMQLGYRPSHEAYLLREYFSGRFGEEFERLNTCK